MLTFFFGTRFAPLINRPSERCHFHVLTVLAAYSKDWTNNMSIREKARLNVWLAKDLAENFGGRKADYLKKLNQRLRTQIPFRPSMLAKAA